MKVVVVALLFHCVWCLVSSDAATLCEPFSTFKVDCNACKCSRSGREYMCSKEICTSRTPLYAVYPKLKIDENLEPSVVNEAIQVRRLKRHSVKYDQDDDAFDFDNAKRREGYHHQQYQGFYPFEDDNNDLDIVNDSETSEIENDDGDDNNELDENQSNDGKSDWRNFLSKSGLNDDYNNNDGNSFDYIVEN